MERGFVENGFIIDLSNTKNTTQLVFELSSIMEHPEVKGKRICLKLGSLDLKQSQLLSIKALIESMDATIAFIDTVSEQTEASAVSLGIIISKVGENSGLDSYTATNTEIKEITIKNSKGFTLPTTGGTGSFLFTLIGCAIMIGGVIIFRKTSAKKSDVA